MPELVIYTDSFPYHNSETFLESEVQFLSEYFEIIYIQPLNGTGRKRPLPDNFRVLKPFCIRRFNRISMYLNGMLHFYILFSEKTLKKNLSSTSILKAIKYTGYGIQIKKQIEKQFIGSAQIHYSYWLNYGAIALAFLKREHKIKCLVSRVHRFDLYPGGGENALDYLKDFTLKYLDRLFFISEDGKLLLKTRYPEYQDKFFLARLGSTFMNIVNPLNSMNCINLISCSNLKPVKRVWKIIDALEILSKTHPELEVNWHHLGDGECLKKLSPKACRVFSSTNISYHFVGSVSNEEVFNYYKNHSFDVFLNVSENEGVPVSIMEAQSCGIPVIATAVGGTPEIVNNECGKLIDVNFEASELADILYEVFRNRGAWEKKRSLSFNNWKNFYDADVNYRAFSRDLLNLANVRESIPKPD